MLRANAGNWQLGGEAKGPGRIRGFLIYTEK